MSVSYWPNLMMLYRHTNNRRPRGKVMRQLSKLHTIPHSPRAYTHWKYQDYVRLMKACKPGVMMYQLCRATGRAPGGVLARLDMLGLIHFNARYQPVWNARTNGLQLVKMAYNTPLCVADIVPRMRWAKELDDGTVILPSKLAGTVIAR